MTHFLVRLVAYMGDTESGISQILIPKRADWMYYQNTFQPLVAKLLRRNP